MLERRDVGRLARIGESRLFHDGEAVFRRGERGFPLSVIVRGRVRIIEPRDDDEDLHVVTHEAGEFTGDVDLLTGRPSVVSGIAEGEVAAVGEGSMAVKLVHEHLAAV